MVLFFNLFFTSLRKERVFNMNHYLEKLEYPKILEKLANYCKSNIGKELAYSLLPSKKKEEVQSLLSQTEEAVNLSIRKGTPPIGEIPENIEMYCKQLEANQSLSMKGLLEASSILRMAREMKSYLYQDENFDLSDFPILDDQISLLYTNLSVEDAIIKCILDEETIDDHASAELFRIRKNIQKAETSIKDSLNKLLHSSYSKYFMEPIITIRSDRYVVPVKEEYRSQIKGFIHDVSSSGSTVYIEPISVFEANNKIASLKVEESMEIEKILMQLSSLLFPYIEEIRKNVSVLGTLDFIFAKANLARELEATMPILSEKKELFLENARHPFIAKDTVVPITVSLGENYSCLLITGPNTGGKTASLKTTGLLTLMACSGLFIPASSQSRIYVFDQVFADIGDEQSIQESLSTFSAHMLHIIGILETATSDSLILLDELGSGTDPTEGASLAIAILEKFYQMGALTMATTHYAELKNYAFVTDGFENASFVFDIEHLKPTYQLLVGIPGKSNAFAISQKLGLSSSILNRAKELLQEDTISMEELLKNIYDDKQTIEKEKEEIVKNEHQITSLRKSLEQEYQSLKEKQTSQKEKAKEEAKSILNSAKEEANALIKELEKLVQNSEDSSSLKKANALRQNLNQSIQELSETPVEENTKSDVSIEDLKVGQVVNLKKWSEPATILSIAGNKKKLQVQIGNAKMNISLQDIESLVKKAPRREKSFFSASTPSSFKSQHATTEINVIGQNVEEACFVIDKYLDDCVLAKLQTVRIVHGKGTGKLRDGIHQFLKKHPHVKSFRLGTFGEGEMGVTVVELK